MTILIAYDGSDPAQAAVEHAVEQYSDEELVLLHVVETARGTLDATVNMIQEALKKRQTKAKENITDEVTALLEDEDVEYTTEIVLGDPVRDTVEYAEANDIDQIIVGNHGRDGASRILLGNVAEGIVRRSPVTVTVVR